MAPFLAQDGDAGGLQEGHYTAMRCLVGQGEGAVVGLLLYSEVLRGVGINLHNLSAGLQGGLDGCLQKVLCIIIHRHFIIIFLFSLLSPWRMTSPRNLVPSGILRPPVS